jgi:hypothetical protein
LVLALGLVLRAQFSSAQAVADPLAAPAPPLIQNQAPAPAPAPPQLAAAEIDGQRSLLLPTNPGLPRFADGRHYPLLPADPDALAEALAAPQLKERLKAECEEAIARGVCGSPFIIIDGEPFFGADRLPQIAHWLETGGF